MTDPMKSVRGYVEPTADQLADALEEVLANHSCGQIVCGKATDLLVSYRRSNGQEINPRVYKTP